MKRPGVLSLDLVLGKQQDRGNLLPDQLSAHLQSCRHRWGEGGGVAVVMTQEKVFHYLCGAFRE